MIKILPYTKLESSDDIPIVLDSPRLYSLEEMTEYENRLISELLILKTGTFTTPSALKKEYSRHFKPLVRKWTGLPK